MKKSYLTVLALIFSVAGFCQANVVLTADKDNTIFSAFTGNSNGAGEYLFVGRNAAANNNSVQRALVHFNLGTIPANAVISSATLTVYTNRSAGGATSVELRRVSADWGEGTSDAAELETSGAPATTGDATWLQRLFPATPWATPGGTYSATSSGSTPVAANIRAMTAVAFTGAGVVADVQSWINNPAGNFGWALVSSDENLSASVKRFISRNSTLAAQRPVLTITYTTNLPVSLKSFTATVKDRKAVIQWSTATELNNDYFSIEKSGDGLAFSAIGRVDGRGNSTAANTYSFTDANLGEGKTSYRLAQYDLDGKVKYSPVISVNLRNAGLLTVKPNPATSVLFVNVANGSTFTITSSAGTTVKKGRVESAGINVQNLPAGQYWIAVQVAGNEPLRSSFYKN
ncbi:DNRLRE domain-containing protein [Segetibacter sp. 3557_3]|uniref:DNRLRE domain-containing protein n=1 Tax=Segetibacter sp. 3557_3 TaxID=2547429 RepID=UPI0010584C20|nr:DNRLRE domain-containing protein [Segetibacter sp. 3557_3]TDH20878.1 DNRLRE domain-containing protein [Segetibacter sp. 3557_3]